MLEFFKPLGAGVLKGIFIDEAEADDEHTGSVVADWTDSCEVLLASCVVHIELDFVTLVLCQTLVRVDDRRGHPLGELILAVRQQEGGLANASIADDHDFDLVALNAAAELRQLVEGLFLYQEA